MSRKWSFVLKPLVRKEDRNQIINFFRSINKTDFRYTILTVVMLSGWCFSQNINLNLNNDTAVHTYSLPVRCPSTASADLSRCTTNGNQSLTGAGSVFPECDLNPSAECSVPGPPYSGSAVHIVRVTDENTDPTSDCPNSGAGCSYHAQPSQGAGDVVWDSTDTRFVVTESGNEQLVYKFDPNPSSVTYLQATQLYTAGHLINSTTSAFSKLAPSGTATVSTWYTLMNGSNVPGTSADATGTTSLWPTISAIPQLRLPMAAGFRWWWT